MSVMPPVYQHLLNCQQYLTIKIIKSLAGRDWIIPIEGIGGVGKTALALAIAWRYVDDFARHPASVHFNAIIWVSAKRKMLNVHGIESTIPTLTTLEDIYYAIADVLGASQILQLPQEERWQAAKSVLLAAGQVLLIVDNLEAVDDPAFAEILDFLRQLPDNAKAIATTRKHEDLPFPVRLDVLDGDSAHALIAQECATRGVDLTDNQIADLIHATGRLPLALWWAIGLMSLDGYGVETVLERLRNRQDDLLQYIFGTAMERLKASAPDSYHALQALAFFDVDTGATIPALASALGLDDESCRVALYRMLNLNLANRIANGGRFRLLPLTRSYALAEAQDDIDWERNAREQWVAYYLQLTKLAEDRRNLKQVVPALLEPELSNIWAVVDWLVAHERVDDLGVIYRYLRPFLYARNHWEPLLKIADSLTVLAVKAGRTNLVSLALYGAIDVLRKRADSQTGDEWLERAKQASIQFNDELLWADVLHYRGHLWDRYRGVQRSEDHLQILRDLERTPDDMLEALAIYRRLDPTRTIQMFNALGNLYRWTHELEKSRQYYEEGLSALNKLAEQKTDGWETVLEYWIPILQGNLALLAGEEGNYAEAEERLNAILSKLDDLIDHAEVHAALALYAYKQGNKEEAFRHHQIVDQIKADLSLTRPISVEDEEWGQLHQGDDG